MEKIIPFRNVKEATNALDNGGRFYNMFTSANDGKITSAELAKAAGVFSNKQMWLYFEMSTTMLSSQAKNSIIQQLSEGLQADYLDQNILYLLPSQVKSEANASQSVIVTGIPKLIDAKSDLTAFIMIPIMTGNVTTFSMIPIFDEYEVYEMHDEVSKEDILIAHHRGSAKLPAKKISCGGVVKAFNKTEDSKENKQDDIFLEVLYYTE